MPSRPAAAGRPSLLRALSAAFLFGPAAPAGAEGLVLVPREDGSLVAPSGPDLVLFQPRPDPAGQAEATAPRVPPPAPDILPGIEEAALRYAGHPALRTAGLSATDWLLLYQANIEVESAYDPRALSPMGAIGLGQLMPQTAAALRVDPHDWRQNLDGSARYLLAQLARFGTPELALAAYNAGPEAVARHGGIPPYDETEGHVRKVLGVFARLQGET